MSWWSDITEEGEILLKDTSKGFEEGDIWGALAAAAVGVGELAYDWGKRAADDYIQTSLTDYFQSNKRPKLSPDDNPPDNGANNGDDNKDNNDAGDEPNPPDDPDKDDDMSSNTPVTSTTGGLSHFIPAPSAGAENVDRHIVRGEVGINLGASSAGMFLWRKIHTGNNIGEATGTGNLNYGDPTQQAYMNVMMNKYQFMRLRGVHVQWNPLYNLSANTQTAGGNTTSDLNSGRVIVVWCNQQNWNGPTSFQRLKLAMLNGNTLNGDANRPLTYNYIPATSQENMADFQTTVPPNATTKMMEPTNWVPTKTYTSASTDPAGFNATQWGSLQVVIYDPLARATPSGSLNLGFLRFTEMWEFKNLDYVKWIGTLPSAVTDTEGNGTATGTVVPYA